MSWDIYGNPLPRGHCEVHPEMPEPYPCGYCRHEMAYVEARRDEEAAYWAAMAEAQEADYYEAFAGSWPT